jgi:putative ABC transport system permease protein
MLEDLRSGVRQIARNPGYASAVVLTLALGVGAPTAVFTLADPMLFRPLPYPEADRLVDVRVSGKGVIGGMLTVPDYLALEAGTNAFESVADFDASVVGYLRGTNERVMAYAVTPGFLQTLRVRPILGRLFLPEEHQPRESGPPVALITHELWRSRFGGTHDVLGKTLDIADVEPKSFSIIGVLPADFVFPDHVNQPPAFLLATRTDPADAAPNRLARTLARLAPGVTREAAAAEVQAIVTSVEGEFPKWRQNRRVSLVTLQDALFGRIRTPLLMLLASTACVLLLASANLAHLFMSRLRARRRELGIRLAIGASSRRLARLLFAESLVMASLGLISAVVAASWLFDLIMSKTPQYAHVYRLLPAGIDWRAALFAAGLISVALAVFGLVPAWRAARGDVRVALTGGTDARRLFGTDRVLIFVQSAVAVILLFTSALVLRSFIALAYQPLGFEPYHTTAVYLELERVDGRDAETNIEATFEARRRAYEELRRELGEPVALVEGLPGLAIPGGVRRAGGGEDDPSVVAYPVSGGFFEVFGLTLLRGRWFDEREAFTNAPVAVVDQRAADTLWPGQEPLGQHVVATREDTTVRVVVGVAKTLKTSLIAGRETSGSAFVPFSRGGYPPIVLRATAAAANPERVRVIVQNAVPGAYVTVRRFTPFERTLGQPRFLAVILGALGAMTIALTVVGIFGVVNHEVARRTREVGIRMALGADVRRVRTLVMKRSTVPAVFGVMAGVGTAQWSTRGLGSILAGMAPNDPLSFMVAATMVIALVAAASAVPAWRASRLDPTTVLRAD